LRSTLEETVEDAFYDIVTFRTGGTIALEREQIQLRQGCVYVAGQTAPGDGIMIRSHPTRGLNGHLIRVTQRSDVVFRFLRLRHGHEGGKIGGGIVLTGSGRGRDVIYDHISASWGGGNTHLQIATSDPGDSDHTLRGSIQNSLIAEGFENRAASFRAATGPSFFGLRQMSYHRNLSAVVGQRHPQVLSGDARRSTAEGAEVVNNLMYGAKNRFTEAEEQTVLDFVKNYQDPGLDRPFPGNRWSLEDDVSGDPGSLYLEGNVLVRHEGDEFESWFDRADHDPLPETFRRNSRLTLPTFPISEMDAVTAREWVLEHAGASRRLTCDGSWTANRDAVDARVVSYVRGRGGPDDAFGRTVAELHGGWPEMEAGAPCPDVDGDGLPDEWEIRWFGCSTCANPGDRTEAGYLVFELYVNGHPNP
jgi:pectate lyase